jgi:large subunit ribosomal protein L4
LKVQSLGGSAARDVTLEEAVFGAELKKHVVHEVVRAELNAHRAGTRGAKTRGEVAGGRAKPWRQKGTGRARQGTTRAPHWRGGGVAFGPQPRDYRTAIPGKVRQLARRSALNARAREGALLVVEDLRFEGPKTAQLAGLVTKLGGADRKVLVLTNGVNRNVYLSGRNLEGAQVLPWTDASAYDVLWSDLVVVERSALGGGAEVAAADTAPAPKKRAARPKTAKAAPKAKAAKAPTAKKTPAAKGKKPAARKKESE